MAYSNFTLEHIVSLSFTENVICIFCEQEIRNLATSLSHHRCIEITNAENYPNVCCVCGQKEAQPWRLKRHFLRHTKEKFYGCNVCEYKSAFVNDVKKHMRKLAGEKPYKCTFCPFTAAHSSTMSYHLRIHQDLKVKCPHCAYKCVKQKDLNTHIERRHMSGDVANHIQHMLEIGHNMS
uniref:Zinc finger X-chromosomal protein n=1 Tax=Cacopsylla melanoneura TaxID=428564 RepID=A0A8D9AG85_9HEMI